MSDSKLTQFDKAVAYAKQGIKIFPVGDDKKPIHKKCGKNFEIATTDLRIVKKWWRDKPDAMIAAPCHDLIVIDFDNHKIPDGVNSENIIFGEVERTLREQGVILDDTHSVSTLSGGTHFYFKNTNHLGRKLKCLPFIDVLGDGGYTILPDQVNYISNDSVQPWNDLKKSLKPLEFAELSYIIDDFAEVTRDVNRKFRSPTKAKGERTDHSVMKTDIDGIKIAKEFSKETGKMVGTIDYNRNDEITFVEQDESVIYKKSEEDFEKSNPKQKLVIDGQPLIIDEGMLNGERINELFYNHQSQALMASHLGLKRVSVGDRRLMHSVLPRHKDDNASMGVRWNQNQTHIIARDFANFFGASSQYCDYNLVRLYAAKMYKANVQRLSAPEFVIWFTRLLYESGVISLSHVMPKYYKTMKSLGKSEKKVAESLLLLEACKRLYDGYSGVTTFSDKFSAAWAGVTPSTVGRVKKSLVAKGFIEYAGVYDCSGGRREDGFYETPLYKIVTEVKSMRITDVVTDKDVLALQERHRQKMNENKDFSDAEKEVNDKYPNLGTIYGMPISEMSHDKVLNFCTDTGIATPVEQYNMFMPVFYSTDFIDDIINDTNQTYYSENFELVIDDENQYGMRPLIAVGDSESYAQAWKEINQKHKEHKNDGFEAPSPHFVVAYDVSDLDLTEEDLDRLTLKFNEYVQQAAFQGIRTRYLNEPEMERVLDGMDEGEE